MNRAEQYKDILSQGRVVLIKSGDGFGGMLLDGNGKPFVAAINTHNLKDFDLAEGQVYSYSWSRYQPITLGSRLKKFNVVCSDKSVAKEKDIIHSAIGVFIHFRGFDLKLVESVDNDDCVIHKVVGKIGYGNIEREIEYTVIETEILHKL